MNLSLSNRVVAIFAFPIFAHFLTVGSALFHVLPIMTDDFMGAATLPDIEAFCRQANGIFYFHATTPSTSTNFDD